MEKHLDIVETGNVGRASAAGGDPSGLSESPSLRPAGQSRRQAVWLLLAIMALHGLFALVVYPRLTRLVPGYLEENDAYLDIARNLAQGRGFAMEPGPHPTLRRMPAYPLALWAVNTIAGERRETVFLFQLGLVAVACVWVFAMGSRISHPAGLLSMFFFGTYPLVIVYTPRYYSEILLLFFITGGLYLLMRYLEERRAGFFLGAVAMLAGAWLTRSVVGFWLAAALLVLLHRRVFTGRQRWLWLGGLAVFATLISPWCLRNWLVSGALIAGNTWNERSAVHGLQIILHPEAESRSRQLDEIFTGRTSREIQRRIGPVDSARQEVREARESARRYREIVAEQPGRVLLSWTRGFGRVFFLTASPPMRWIGAAINVLLILLALLGELRSGITSRRGDRPGAGTNQSGWPEGFKTLVWLLFGITYCIYSILYPHFRYMLPTLPAVALLAGRGAACGWPASRSRRLRAR